jgi:formylglycine-generating enzyme required for sulfatase activity
MATGRPPFRAATAYAVLKRVVEDDPRPIQEVIPEVPQWLCDIIAKLHAKKPQDRFQSAREVADVLADCKAQLQANANLKDFSRIPQSKPAAGRFGRWKWVAAAALLLPLLALVITEIAGVTHWLRNLQPTSDLVKNGDGDRGQRERPENKSLPPDYTNSLGMKFKLIPAGKFTMGSPREVIEHFLKKWDKGWPKERLLSEGPEHEVEITQPFYMGATEVTVVQFRQFVEESKYIMGSDDWKNPPWGQSDDDPVVFVSWHNAVDFCKWLSKKEGKHYRLPTEAEWEYCCRAGKAGTRYSFGDNDDQLEDHAWYKNNSGDRTHRVAQLKPNAWGLFDMHGNASEWSQDKYDPNYYTKSPAKDPPGGIDGDRVIRGGSWDTFAEFSRSASRQLCPAGLRFRDLGFRVLLVAPREGVWKESGK